MIDRVMTLRDTPGEIIIDTHLPISLEVPEEHITLYGTRMGIFVEDGFERFIIHEILNKRIYQHYVIRLGEDFVPISTLLRDRHGAVKKVHTSGIVDLLLLGEERGMVRYSDLPSTPYGTIMNIMDRAQLSPGFKFREVATRHLIGEIKDGLSSHSTPYSSYDDGYVVSSSIMTKIKKVANKIQYFLNAHRAEDISHNVAKDIVSSAQHLNRHFLLGEKDTIVHKGNQRIRDLIKKESIYYYNVDAPCPYTMLGADSYSSMINDYPPPYVNNDISKNFDIDILELLRAIGLYMPAEFTLSFIGNECVHFQGFDDLWPTWVGGCALHQIGFLEHEFYLKQKLHLNIYHVLKYIHHFFGNVMKQGARVVIKRTNDTTVDMSIKIRQIVYTQQCDLMMMDIAAPEQFVVIY